MSELKSYQQRCLKHNVKLALFRLRAAAGSPKETEIIHRLLFNNSLVQLYSTNPIYILISKTLLVQQFFDLSKVLGRATFLLKSKILLKSNIALFSLFFHFGKSEILLKSKILLISKILLKSKVLKSKNYCNIVPNSLWFLDIAHFILNLHAKTDVSTTDKSCYGITLAGR